MPSIPATWFERNFGRAPDGFTTTTGGSLAETENDDTSLTGWMKPDDPFQSQSFYKVQFDQQVQRTRTQAQTLQAKMAADRERQARIRHQIRASMEATRQQNVKRSTTDWSPLNVDPAAAAADAEKNPMITPEKVRKDLGRGISQAGDPFWTGRFETTETGIYDKPSTKWERVLDVGKRIGTETISRPQVAHAIYRDSNGEAMRFAQQRRMGQKQIMGWQDFFAARGIIKPGSFQFGVWGPETQAAMYQLMGEANSMGQTVEGVRAGYEQQWKALGGTPATGFGSTGGAAAAPRDVTQKVYSITSLAKGGELLRSYLQQELGRDPSRAEIQAYVRLLNGKERKNPTITRTHYSADGSSSTSTVKDANVDPGDTANTYVGKELEDELKARQAMEYMNILGGM